MKLTAERFQRLTALQGAACFNTAAQKIFHIGFFFREVF